MTTIIDKIKQKKQEEKLLLLKKLQQFRKSLKAEYEEYKQTLLMSSPEHIFDNSFKTSVIETFYNFLMNYSFEGDEDILNRSPKGLLDHLYYLLLLEYK